MRFLSRVFVLSLLIVFAAWSQPIVGQHADTPPEKIVREFYSWYLHGLKGNTSEPFKQKVTSLKYLAPQLYANVPRLTRRLDADIFICAQDWNPEWEKNFAVDPPAVKGSIATTLVTLSSGETDKLKIKVTLKRLGGGWRIDGVRCVN